MSDFQKAVELVHQALRGMHECGTDLRASAAVLRQLREPPHAPSPGSSPLLAEEVIRPAAEPRALASAVRESLAQSATKSGKAEQLAEMGRPILACMKCSHLAASRTQVVFGVGNPNAELMFVGEAPGEEEDFQGTPFVGLAGELLTKIIGAMGYERDDVYLANVLKCRPDLLADEPHPRKPRLEEVQACLPYLRQQIEIIRPRVLVALGASALEGLTGETTEMSQTRGQWRNFAGIPLMATYHPAELLQNQAEKPKVWEDMLSVLEKLGGTISTKQRNYFAPKS